MWLISSLLPFFNLVSAAGVWPPHRAGHRAAAMTRPCQPYHDHPAHLRHVLAEPDFNPGASLRTETESSKTLCEILTNLVDFKLKFEIEST
jgi:hypothetical protein